MAGSRPPQDGAPARHLRPFKRFRTKARGLKSRKVQQLGELVIATGADSLNAEELAGALIALAETKDTARKETWAKRARC
jgi:DNA-binding protein H-NS